VLRTRAKVKARLTHASGVECRLLFMLLSHIDASTHQR